MGRVGPRYSLVSTVAVLAGITLVLAGCAWFGVSTGMDLPSENRARELVDTFMTYRLEGQIGKARSLLTEKGQASFDELEALRLDLTTSNPHVTGYYIVADNTVGDGPENDTPGLPVTVRIREAYTGQTYAGRWDEQLVVIQDNDEPRINSARFANRVEITANEGRLWLLRGENRESLLALEDLPEAFRPQGAEPGVEFGPGERGFGPTAFAPDGERLAFSTYGVHGFLGVLSPGDKKLQGIDLYFEGAVSDLIWSLGGSYLAVQVLEPSGWTRLRVYEQPAGTLVDTPLNAEFPPQKYALTVSRWREGEVLEFVAGPAEGTAAPVDRAGLWQLEVADGTLVEIP